MTKINILSMSLIGSLSIFGIHKTLNDNPRFVDSIMEEDEEGDEVALN